MSLSTAVNLRFECQLHFKVGLSPLVVVLFVCCEFFCFWGVKGGGVCMCVCTCVNVWGFLMQQVTYFPELNVYFLLDSILDAILQPLSKIYCIFRDVRLLVKMQLE